MVRRRPARRARSPLAQTVLACALSVVAVIFSARAARASVEAPRSIDLYTVGAGDELYASFGHSLLCVHDDAHVAEGRTGLCYDYGVASAPSALSVMWSSIRGKPVFTVVAVEERAALAFFEGQGRRVERQTLPLSTVEASVLADRLASDAASRFSYAYHPYFANCATQLRDRIDAVTHGRLRPGVEGRKDSYRVLMEQGLSGRLFQLAGIALFLGGPNEVVPDAWGTMFLPEALRDGVTVRLDAPPVQIAERVAIVLPTTTAVGRLGIVVLGLVLSGVVGPTARRGRARVGLGIVGTTLGVLALAAVALATTSTWPELTRNANLLALWPTDLALPFLGSTWRRRYARARIASAATLAVLELVGVVAQPVLATAALVLLPMLAVTRGGAASRASPLRPAEASAPPRARAA